MFLPTSNTQHSIPNMRMAVMLHIHLMVARLSLHRMATPPWALHQVTTHVKTILCHRAMAQNTEDDTLCLLAIFLSAFPKDTRLLQRLG